MQARGAGNRAYLPRLHFPTPILQPLLAWIHYRTMLADPPVYHLPLCTLQPQNTPSEESHTKERSMNNYPYQSELKLAEEVYARWEKGRCEVEGTEHGPRAKELHLCSHCGRIACDHCARPVKLRRQEMWLESDGAAYRAWATMNQTVDRLLSRMHEIRSYLVYEHDIMIKPGFLGFGSKKYRKSDGRPWEEIVVEKEAELDALMREYKRIPHVYPIKMAAMVKTQVDYRKAQHYEHTYSPYICRECRTEEIEVGVAPSLPKNLTMWHDD
jgi:hypothetical protein